MLFAKTKFLRKFSNLQHISLLKSPNFDACENEMFYSTDESMETLITWETVHEQCGRISDCYMGQIIWKNGSFRNRENLQDQKTAD